MSAVNAKDSSTASAPAPSVFARLVERSIPEVEAGRLAVELPGGETIVRDGRAAGPEARMTVQRRRAFRRILLDGEVGFVDGYLDGDWSTPDLPALLSFLIANEAALRPRRRASRLTAIRTRLAHALRANTRRGSRRNIAAHYDLGNAFYAQWLDAGMNYSSALYRGGESLEAAQAAKIERIVELLEPTAGARVLEIGCGWGALAERLAPEAAYTGITLSTEQRDYASRRLAAAGRPDPDIRLQDYRDVPEAFERIVSIEMFEAVGERYWPVYFDKLRSTLAAGGIAVLQVITIAANRFPDYRRRPDFIQRHIFPGGMLPTIAHLEALAERSGLSVAVLQSFGDSYAETLREWRRRFNQSWAEIAPLGFDERFRRMWDYYLAYCETGFRQGTIDVSLIQLRG
jgi:cyclopropane-fatty-acyl-phospholipid synthase